MLHVNTDSINTEHILLRIITRENSIGAAVLEKLGVDLNKLRSDVEAFAQHRPLIGTIPWTPNALKVMEIAGEEAFELSRTRTVGTEHLLLGLLAERECVAGQLLRNLGLTIEAVRDEVRRAKDASGGRSAAATDLD